MITLKKSFELQNYLRDLYGRALSHLSFEENITTTTQTHMKRKAYADAEDEVIEKPKTSNIDFDTNTVIAFTQYMQNQITSLTDAINDAKHGDDCDYDAMISNNTEKRKFLRVLESMVNQKPRERTVSGAATKFNAEGNQVKYYYDVKEVTTICFDRNNVRKLISKLRAELDEVSGKIDEMLIRCTVNFDSPLEIGDSFSDALEKFVNLA